MSVATGSVAIELIEYQDGYMATCNALGLRVRGASETEALKRLKAFLDARYPSLLVHLDNCRADKTRSLPR
jgi:hypothetical protein